mmetsp:Transcript_6723/g.19433  ORF Transcript_6723/g.19433 Transcript_6723/m.19433 type:complete len:548 (-) Transcript_6723:430-2073(-)
MGHVASLLPRPAPGGGNPGAPRAGGPGALFRRHSSRSRGAPRVFIVVGVVVVVVGVGVPRRLDPPAATTVRFRIVLVVVVVVVGVFVGVALGQLLLVVLHRRLFGRGRARGRAVAPVPAVCGNGGPPRRQRQRAKARAKAKAQAIPIDLGRGRPVRDSRQGIGGGDDDDDDASLALALLGERGGGLSDGGPHRAQGGRPIAELCHGPAPEGSREEPPLAEPNRGPGSSGRSCVGGCPLGISAACEGQFFLVVVVVIVVVSRVDDDGNDTDNDDNGGKSLFPLVLWIHPRGVRTLARGHPGLPTGCRFRGAEPLARGPRLRLWTASLSRPQRPRRRKRQGQRQGATPNNNNNNNNNKNQHHLCGQQPRLHPAVDALQPGCPEQALQARKAQPVPSLSPVLPSQVSRSLVLVLVAGVEPVLEERILQARQRQPQPWPQPQQQPQPCRHELASAAAAAASAAHGPRTRRVPVEPLPRSQYYWRQGPPSQEKHCGGRRVSAKHPPRPGEAVAGPQHVSRPHPRSLQGQSRAVAGAGGQHDLDGWMDRYIDA